MPWTTPRTWVTNELVTAALLNTHLRDNLTFLFPGALSATPPGAPGDGQLWAMPIVPAAGIVWMFRYNPAGTTYLWEFVGGAPQLALVDTEEGPLTSGAFGNLATVGPDITVPRAGQYLVEFGATLRTDLSAAFRLACSPALNAGVASNVDQASVAGPSPGGNSHEASVTRTLFKTYAAADVIRLQYYATGATNTYASKRWVKVLPRRVT